MAFSTLVHRRKEKKGKRGRGVFIFHAFFTWSLNLCFMAFGGMTFSTGLSPVWGWMYKGEGLNHTCTYSRQELPLDNRLARSSVPLDTNPLSHCNTSDPQRGVCLCVAEHISLSLARPGPACPTLPQLAAPAQHRGH